MLSHHSYDWPARRCDTPEQQERLMEATRTVLDELFADPEAYWKRSDDFSYEDALAALKDPEFQAQLEKLRGSSPRVAGQRTHDDRTHVPGSGTDPTETDQRDSRPSFKKRVWHVLGLLSTKVPK